MMSPLKFSSLNNLNIFAAKYFVETVTEHGWNSNQAEYQLRAVVQHQPTALLLLVKDVHQSRGLSCDQNGMIELTGCINQ